jgi:hypothetical protein
MFTALVHSQREAVAARLKELRVQLHDSQSVRTALLSQAVVCEQAALANVRSNNSAPLPLTPATTTEVDRAELTTRLRDTIKITTATPDVQSLIAGARRTQGTAISAEVMDAIPTADEVNAIDALVLEALMGPEHVTGQEFAADDTNDLQPPAETLATATLASHAEIIQMLKAVQAQLDSLKAGQETMTVGMVESLPQQLNAFAGQITRALAVVPQPRLLESSGSKYSVDLNAVNEATPNPSWSPSPGLSSSASPASSPLSGGARKSRRSKA